MQPKPKAETSRPLFPSVRVCIADLRGSGRRTVCDRDTSVIRRKNANRLMSQDHKFRVASKLSGFSFSPREKVPEGRMRVRDERDAPRSRRTLTPTPLPMGEGLG